MAKTHIEQVKRDYTEAEITTFGRDSARLTGEIADLELQKKAATDQFKNLITEREAEVYELSKRINQGYEITPTPCDVFINKPTAGMKTFISQKTGAIVKITEMSDEDRQLDLYGG